MKKVLNNIVFSFGAQIFAKLSTAVLTIFIARKLGAEIYGTYSFATSLLALFSLLPDLGVSTFLTRNIARKPVNKDIYYVNSFVIKIVLLISSLILINIVILFLKVSIFQKNIIIMLLIPMLINSLSGFYSGFTNGFQAMKYGAIGCIIERTIVVLSGITYLYLGGSLQGFIVISILGSVIQLGYFYLITSTKFKINFKINKINVKVIKKTFIHAIPLGITAYVILFYYKIDTVLLGIMKGNHEVAYYSAAYMLVNFLSFIPSTLMSVFFPILSSQHKVNRKQYEKTVVEVYKLLINISFPISLIIFAIAPKIILIFFGNGFRNSVAPLQILIWSIAIMFFNSFIGNLAVIEGKAFSITIIVTITAILNLVLNIIFIPYFSYLGSSAITVISELISLILTLKFVIENHYLQSQTKLWVKSSLIFGILYGVLFLSKSFNLILQMVTAVICYLFLIFAFKSYTLLDIKAIFKDRTL